MSHFCAAIQNLIPCEVKKSHMCVWLIERNKGCRKREWNWKHQNLNIQMAFSKTWWKWTSNLIKVYFPCSKNFNALHKNQIYERWHFDESHFLNSLPTKIFPPPHVCLLFDAFLKRGKFFKWKKLSKAFDKSLLTPMHTNVSENWFNVTYKYCFKIFGIKKCKTCRQKEKTLFFSPFLL